MPNILSMGRISRYEDHRATILALVAENVAAHSRPPTVRTLAETCGVGVATAHSYLGQLAEEGMVEWAPKSHRSLRLTPLATQQLTP